MKLESRASTYHNVRLPANLQVVSARIIINYIKKKEQFLVPNVEKTPSSFFFFVLSL